MWLNCWCYETLTRYTVYLQLCYLPNDFHEDKIQNSIWRGIDQRDWLRKTVLEKLWHTYGFLALNHRNID